jgi:hypothetical protein
MSRIKGRFWIVPKTRNGAVSVYFRKLVILPVGTTFHLELDEPDGQDSNITLNFTIEEYCFDQSGLYIYCTPLDAESLMLAYNAIRTNYPHQTSDYPHPKKTCDFSNIL